MSKSEVNDSYFTLLVNHYVIRFKVTVHESSAVKLMERLHAVYRVADTLREREFMIFFEAGESSFVKGHDEAWEAMLLCFKQDMRKLAWKHPGKLIHDKLLLSKVLIGTKLTK